MQTFSGGQHADESDPGEDQFVRYDLRAAPGRPELLLQAGHLSSHVEPRVGPPALLRDDQKEIQR